MAIFQLISHGREVSEGTYTQWEEDEEQNIISVTTAHLPDGVCIGTDKYLTRDALMKAHNVSTSGFKEHTWEFREGIADSFVIQERLYNAYRTPTGWGEVLAGPMTHQECAAWLVENKGEHFYWNDESYAIRAEVKP